MSDYVPGQIIKYEYMQGDAPNFAIVIDVDEKGIVKFLTEMGGFDRKHPSMIEPVKSLDELKVMPDNFRDANNRRDFIKLIEILQERGIKF